jgi:hypothetical protein
MQLAVSPTGERISASRGQDGFCPTCKAKLIPKCGEIVVHHWAHQADDCDPWSEGETPWHAASKAMFPEKYREVTIGPHRADVAIPGRIIEFQGQSLKPEEIREREKFYGKSLVWVVKLDDAADRISFTQLKDGLAGRLRYSWRIPRPTWGFTGRPLYMDLGEHSWIKTGDKFRYFKVERHPSFSISWGHGVAMNLAQFMRDVTPVNASLFDAKDLIHAPR